MISLYIVGHSQGVKSPLTMGLSEWSDYPELGPVGESLIEFIVHALVLCCNNVLVVTKQKLIGRKNEHPQF